MTKTLAEIRTDYQSASLNESDMLADPFAQFDKWFREAMEAEVLEVNAMNLATATPDGKPASRIVLLKGLDERGFTFYTNYHSDKGQMLAVNPHAALNFFWPELERQVRIEGEVEKVSSQESDEYFASRPKGSQIGAWVSEQSYEIESREELDKKLEELTAFYADKSVMRPPHWGGYRVVPHTVEFWQGRPSRLHDRLKYIKGGEGFWKLVRLSP
ncbi:MAG: pyridoxamine 5'-phosphate oxidase [Bacteroidetes bacterium]|nr:MAG: pyridoxamine 5'-phosphate oxidase [Bacteroidota bacterium]